MRVFVAGATGAVGVPLVLRLQDRGHDVVGLARSDANVAALKGLGATPARAGLFDAVGLAEAMRGCDAVVRVATHIAKSAKPTPEDWALNDRIRDEGTRALLEAARKADVPSYMQESIVWLARPDSGAPFDESTPPNPGPTTRSALTAERHAEEAAGAGLRVATLRLGWLYGPQSFHTRDLAATLRRGKQPVPGQGAARLSFLHVEDAASAFAAAVDARATGLYHVVDGQPTSLHDFLHGFARALGAPPPGKVPEFLARLVVGREVMRFLTTPMVTGNAAFAKSTGWTPGHPRVQEGLAQVVAAWGEA